MQDQVRLPEDLCQDWLVIPSGGKAPLVSGIGKKLAVSVFRRRFL